MAGERTLAERAKDLFPPVANRYTDLGVVRGLGSYLWTEDGRQYLDFASGVAVVNVGHNHPSVLEAAMKQMNDLVHGGHNVVYYPTYVELAEQLIDKFGGGAKVYFSNSGAEANEAAIKLAKKCTQRPGIISFKRSFHGRTLAMTTLTASSALYRKDYEGLLPSVYFADYPYALRSGRCEQDEVAHCLQSVQDLLTYLIAPDQVAAIVVEPIQGEGGYIIPPVTFLQGLRQICDHHGILLIFDEIQTAFGRTGYLYAWQHFHVQPDVMTLAKGIANGFPLSAVVGRADVMDQWPTGSHGGTYGGNPVATAAALAVLELLEGGLLQNATNMGEYLKQRLKGLQRRYPDIREVRGVGLMIGMEFLDSNGHPMADAVAAVRQKALENGLILLPCGVDKNVIRFIPPTSVSTGEIDEALEILESALDAVF